MRLVPIVLLLCSCARHSSRSPDKYGGPDLIARDNLARPIGLDSAPPGSPVPELGGMLLLGSGLALAVLAKRRRKP